MVFCVQTALKPKKYICGVGCTGKKTRLEVCAWGDRWIYKGHIKNETSVEAVLVVPFLARAGGGCSCLRAGWVLTPFPC